MHYDGPDLEEVCALTGLSRAELVAAHTGTPWTAAFAGFAPGFAYLTGGDERLEVPRRSEPRTSVPPGSVGLAGGYSAVYPRAPPRRLAADRAHRPGRVGPRRANRRPCIRPGSVIRFVDAGAADDGGADRGAGAGATGVTP